MYKKFLCLFSAVMIACTAVPFSYAAENVSNSVQAEDDGSIVPYADVIVYKYRLLDGVIQYRRWNETRGYWVDPYWINM